MKWEHLILENEDGLSKKELDKAGDQGWELFSVGYDTDGIAITAVFKRLCN